MNEERNEERDRERAMQEELQQLAYRMALALADLQCSDCCGPVHTFIEKGCEVYREEWEWACFVQLVHHGQVKGRGHG
jgi:hypothetical protein